MYINTNSFITNRTPYDITDPTDKAINKYKFHPNILLIQKYLENNYTILLKTVEIGNNNIPPKSSKISTGALHKLFKDSIEKSKLPQNLKLADTTPVYKNDPLVKQIIDPSAYCP